ncbi:TPA: HPF/RaiA family ribosome-associated protein [Legionella pneumophila]|nr:ribosome-associated translation inhibitor RaiA [Legionella pneumophila]
MSTVQTTVRGISSTPAINYHVDRHFNKLERAYSKINKCRVVIDLAKKNTHKDKLYSVSINITIPGKELISKKQDPNLFIAIRNSFLAIEQLLEKHYKKKLLFNKGYSNYLRDYKSDPMVRAS